MRRQRTPAPTAQEVEIERRQRSELDTLTREENERLKAISRARRGRRTLLGSGSELGIRPGLGAGGIRAGGARGGGTAAGGGRAGGGGPGGIMSGGSRGGGLRGVTGMRGENVFR